MNATQNAMRWFAEAVDEFDGSASRGMPGGFSVEIVLRRGSESIGRAAVSPGCDATIAFKQSALTEAKLPIPD